MEASAILLLAISIQAMRISFLVGRVQVLARTVMVIPYRVVAAAAADLVLAKAVVMEAGATRVAYLNARAVLAAMRINTLCI
jgi:hypothetical protein